MKLNVFSVSTEKVQAMKDKFEYVGLKKKHSGIQGEWATSFYFSEDEEPNPIPWVETYAEFLTGSEFKNLIYFGAYVFEKDGHCYVLSYGKTHFYIRPYCEHDYGIEIAKRIANENDIKQTSSKKFAGSKKKEIKSYTKNTSLDIESGESIDYVQATILTDQLGTYGRSGKFGASLLINPAITKDDLHNIFDKLNETKEAKERFQLPRTVTITNATEISIYDQLLLDTIKQDESSADFTEGSFDLVGVDFVFSGQETYTLKCRGYESIEYNQLDRLALKNYIENADIDDDDIFNIAIKVEKEDQRAYQKKLKDSLDFIVDDENVILSQGRWVRFNEDYVNQLNDYVDSIEVEETEDAFKEISQVEGDFNASQVLKDAGYTVADKDFSKIKVNSSTPIEAWDLHKDTTVYAVKFGTAQKVGYVCDQATAVAEIIRTKSNIKKLDQEIKSYCLWLGFELVNPPEKLSDSRSIILKQKLEAWARKCREIGIEPKVKISRKSV